MLLEFCEPSMQWKFRIWNNFVSRNYVNLLPLFFLKFLPQDIYFFQKLIRKNRNLFYRFTWLDFLALVILVVKVKLHITTLIAKKTKIDAFKFNGILQVNRGKKFNFFRLTSVDLCAIIFLICWFFNVVVTEANF